jgi:NAD(P)-dependent dehydrogenase (short-subunit alcohol dehydrogenase family)
MIKSKQKVALITGSSKGIGKEIAIGLAKTGADIVVNYNSDKKGALKTEKKIKDLGVDALAVKANVGKREDVDKMFDRIIEKFGKIDILINNAAIAIWKPFEKFTDQDWDNTINTNLKSIFMCTQLSIPYMKKSGSGTIINIGSVGGYAYLDCLVPYCASKGGINMITRSLAVELAKYNIRVNCIAPGTIAVKRNFDIDPEYPENWKPYIPLKRVGEMEDVVEPVLFFCSDKSRYITGQVIYIDGGNTCYFPMPGAGFVEKST